MPIKFLIILVFLVIFTVPAMAANPMFTVRGVVKTVYDGNSLKIEGSDKLDVVLMGVKAPLPGKPYGDKAHKALSRMLLGKSVTVIIYERIPSKRNNPDSPQYEMVSVVILDNKIINLEMVAEGYGRVEKLGLDAGIDSELVAVEGEARKRKRGLWQLPTKPREKDI